MAEQGGVARGLIVGIGALVIVTIVVLLIVSTLIGGGLLRSTDVSSTGQDVRVKLNDTTNHTLVGFSTTFNYGYTITSVANGSGGGYTLVQPTNYTFNSGTGVLTNASIANSEGWTNITVNYTYTPKKEYERSTDFMAVNMTRGVNSVSSNLPTILLLGAVILLFGIIVLLVRQAQGMGMMGGQGSL
jgi:hypothetical protein